MRTALAMLSGLCVLSAGGADVTLTSLLREMADRGNLARLPSPDFRLKQASSHDRRKIDPYDAAGWHSNQDYGQFIHTETNENRREWVIMDAEGPGAITRFWIPLLADKDAQRLRFYFDGSPTPQLTVKFNDLLSGRAWARPPFAFIGWNEHDVNDQLKPEFQPRRGVSGDLYLPIPFAKGLKLTTDSPPFYYVINYRAYTPGTQVETFSLAGLEAAAPVLAQTAAALTGPKLIAEGPPGETIAPGQTLSRRLAPGPAAVDSVLVRVDPQAARSLVLTGKFDGEETIWCPLAEFFGGGPRGLPVRDALRAVNRDGCMEARWLMPYQRSAELALVNLGTQPVQALFGAETTAWQWDERSLHFHANWHSTHGLKTRPMSDWNYLQVTAGSGVYVGDTLSVYSPVKAWYGEGDERIYYDGATFPAHIGTGTEDYYGYAWGMAGFFNSPFISMPQRDFVHQDDWRGYTTTSRVRLLDGIPFGSALRHDMEIWNWADTSVDYAVGTFWYARPGATHNRAPEPAEAVAPLQTPPGERKRAGAVEFETLPLLATSPGLKHQTQDAGLAEGEWSGGQQLFAMATKVGDFLEVKLPVADDQPRKVSLWLTTAADYGKLKFTINGQPAGAEFDGYSVRPVVAGPVELGTFTPVGGGLTLRVEVSGTNAASKGARHYFGLDCAVLAKP